MGRIAKSYRGNKCALLERQHIVTHPQLIQDAYAKFSKLTPERFKYSVGQFWLSQKEVDHMSFAPMPHLRLSALKFFFVQTPPEYNGSQTIQILSMPTLSAHLRTTLRSRYNCKRYGD